MTMLNAPSPRQTGTERRRGFARLLLVAALQVFLFTSFLAPTASADPMAEENPARAASEKEAAPGAIRFIGKNLFATADGVFHTWRVLDHRIDLARPEETFALVEVDLRSVDTGIERRDNHLRDPDFFETETYPVATARVHSLRPSKDESETYDLLIDLDLHGVQKTVPGQARLIGRDPVAFRGETTIDRTDFGIGPAPSRWNPATPKAEIPIRFEASFDPKPR